MKKTILGASREVFCSRLNRIKRIVVLLGILTAAITFLLVGSRDDSNHILMLVLTIAVDVAYGWYLIAIMNIYVLPMQRLLKAYDGKKAVHSGSIAEVSADTYKMQGIDCFKLILESEDKRAFFLPDTLELKKGELIKLYANGSIIAEVECE